ncbi:MAG: tetraacyldisaccharide 4'-kinase [Deltaproteobacteria bacterium]|nr:MAG: tetraacyldisaccharide 4'-kinase [Deltaproteobacteria bacterium]
MAWRLTAMAWRAPDWTRVHRDEPLGFWAMPLAVCSIPYGIGSRIRAWSYKRGILKRKRLPGFVVSVGNLTVGGTGKTPAVEMLAGWARENNFRVAVLSRGYQGKYREKVLAVSDRKGIRADCTDSGDEAYLLAGRLSGIPVVVSRDRYSAGLFARERFGSDFFILDDGFQHLELERDVDIVLMDAERPFGNGHLLPWGPLREPVAQLARADAFVFTRSSVHRQVVPDVLSGKFSDTPVFFADHRASEIVFPDADRLETPDFINGKKVVAFAGIGRPDQFRKNLEELGATVVHFRGFRDHHIFARQDLETLIQVREELGAAYIITTEKDWVRLRTLNRRVPELAFVRIAFVLLSGGNRFFRFVADAARKAASR